MKREGRARYTVQAMRKRRSYGGKDLWNYEDRKTLRGTRMDDRGKDNTFAIHMDRR